MKFSVPQAVEILKQTPSTLESLLSPLSSDWIEGTGDKSDWDPVAVVGHLIHADETDWIPRAEVILSQSGDRKFPDFDRCGQFDKFDGKSLEFLLAEFARVRKTCLETLFGWKLTPEQLDLKGIHPAFGEVSLEQLLATWVVHDLGHIKQIVTYLAKKYSSAVGPWSEYLSILK